MAHMYPNHLGEAFSAAHTPSEKRVYDALSSSLDDSYFVFHDLQWDDPSIEDNHPRGQADFIIAHPERGFIVIEVKGGRCSYRAADRVWTTIDRQGSRDEIRDPFKQAATAARVIGKLLIRQIGETAYVPVGQSAALFPDCNLPREQLSACVQPWRILDEESLFNPKHSIRLLFESAFPDLALERHQGMRLIDGLKRLWGVRDAEGKQLLGPRIRHSYERLVALSEQQLHVITSFRSIPRLQVTGCAGSGKTTLALHKVKMLAEQGKRVGLFCFNIPLAGYLKRQCDDCESVVVGPIAELCRQWLQAAGVSLQWEDRQEWWDETLPNLVVENLDRVPHRFDAIVVDEGQDIRENYWTMMELLLADPEQSVFYIFADHGQNIYHGKMSLSFEVLPFYLEQNIRNTNQVFSVVKNCCGLPEEIRPSGVDGPPARLYRYEDDAHMRRVLQEVVEKLCCEGIALADIAVLGTKSQANTALRHGEKLGGFRLVEKREKNGDLVSMTVHKFKGLEASAIVLCELDGTRPNFDELLYIGMTRTTGILVALATGEVYDRLAKGGFRVVN